MHHADSSPLGKIFMLLVLIAQSFCIPAEVFPQSDQEMGLGIALSQPLTVNWSYESDATTNLTPATDSDRIFFPLASGTLISIRANNGQLIWKTELGGELSSSPTADESNVYVASEINNPRTTRHTNGVLRALGREGGITLWMRTLPGSIQGSLVTNDANLFGGSSDGRVYAIKKETGDIAWTMQHSAPFASHPTLSGSRLYIGSNDGSLFSLDQTTGKVHWRYRTQGAIHGRAIVFSGIVYFGSDDGFVYAIGETDGRLRWRKRTGASVQTVAYSQTGLIAVSLDNFVYCLSFSKGDGLWKRQLAGRLATEPLIARDGALLLPFSSPIGVVLDLHDGKQLNSLPIGKDNDITASPVVVGNLLFLTTRHGFLAFSRPK